jgi:tetratricopeptide (TPR) repeat protein
VADATAPTNRTIAETLAANQRPDKPGDEYARGTVIGRYVALGRVGAGAMGVVYAAYDPDLDRKVAVKLLQQRGDEEEGSNGHRRLLREAQAMAQLNHPNVVTVHDVGVHDRRVFVAMEFVQGITVREWLRNKPAWPEVLDVFVAAGRGLQAAHDQSLVHRDFKPDNVMLSDAVHGARRVRVMDFGLARTGTDNSRASTAESTGDGLTASGRRALDVALTQQGSLVGTPAYMSPEQIAHEGNGPLADQFSFCVSLWEALYGKRPFPGDTFAVLAAAVLEGQIDPPPSGAAVPRWLRRVVQRGLARDPGERWPSMAALLDALTRDRTRAQRRVGFAALGGLGVLAAGAFAWQHAKERRQVAACDAEGASIETVWNDDAREQLRASFLATEVPFASATADRVMPWLDDQARAWAEHRIEACSNAKVEERPGWDADVLDRAVWCLDERRMEFESLVATLSDVDAAAVPRSIGAAAALRSVDPCLDRDRLLRLPAPPQDRRADLEAVRAELSRSGTLRDTAQYEEGLAVAEQALRTAEEIAWPPLVAAARRRVGGMLEQSGRLADAEQTLTQAYFEAAHAGATDVAASTADDLAYMLGYRLARPVEGRTWSQHAEVHQALLPDPAGITLAQHLNARAAIHWAAGEYDEAHAVFERVLEIQERAFEPDNPALARTLNNLAILQSTLGQHDAAKASHERAIAITEKTFGPEHPDTALGLANLAIVHWHVGEYPRAMALHERALAIREKAFGPEHVDVAASLNELGLVARAMADYDSAQRYLERALRIREKTFGPFHPDVGRTLINLANVFSDRGEREKATALYERSLEIHEKALGPDHPDVAGNLINLVNVRSAAGSHAEARALCERAIGILEQTVGEEHRDYAAALHTLADVLVESGDYEEARARYERAIEIASRAQAPEHLDVAMSLTSLARVHELLGRHDEAAATYRRAIEVFEKVGGGAHPDLAPALAGAAIVALAQGRAADALPLAERAYDLLDGRRGDALVRAEVRFVLAQSLWETSRDRTRARALAEEARDVLREAGEASRLADVERWLAAHATDP